MPRPGAAAEDVPRLREAVLPHRGRPVGYRVLLADMLGKGAQAEAAAEKGGGNGTPSVAGSRNGAVAG
jgi:hypothetical protein